MKKKIYQSPTIKVVKVQQAQIICISPNASQNESYIEESTSDWYNLN